MSKTLVLFFVLTATILEVTSVCVNKTALYEVIATRHSVRRSTGRKFSGNFYDLENQVMVNVHQANVTDLCEGMIRNFPNLEVLSLINVNLSRIQPNAFQNVKKLKQLSLAVNHLTEIVNGAFSNLPSLEVLYLSGNEIEKIEEGSFSELPHLKSVHLDRNKLTRIPGNLFSNCLKISIVDFAFNKLESIDKESFQDLKPQHGRHLQIILTNNKINRIDPMAMELPNPVVFHIENNGLNNMDVMSNVFSRVKDYSRLFFNKNEFGCVPDDVVLNTRNSLKDIDVRENPLRCDCMERIKHLLGEEAQGSGKFFYASIFNCGINNEIY